MAKKKSIGKSPGKKSSDGKARRGRKSNADFPGMGAMNPGEIIQQLADQTGMDPMEILSAIFGSESDKRALLPVDLPTAAKKPKPRAGSIEFLVDQAGHEGAPERAEVLLLQAVEKR